MSKHKISNFIDKLDLEIDSNRFAIDRRRDEQTCLQTDTIAEWPTCRAVVPG